MPAPSGLLGAFEPQQSLGESAFDGILRLAFRNGEERAAGRALAGNTAHKDARKRMLPVRGDGKLLDGLVRELFREDAAQLLTKIFAGNLFRVACEIEPDNLEALGSGSSEMLDREGQTKIGLLGNGQHTASHVAVVGPEVKEGFIRGAAKFPRDRCSRGGPSSGFTDFGGA